MTLDKLQERVGKIKSLLDDPQPGLFTWCSFLAGQIDGLCKDWQTFHTGKE